MKRFTLFLKRIFIITMAAFMLVFSPVSAFASTSMAAELVGGSTLVELLAELLFSIGVTYGGYELSTYPYTYESLLAFAASDEGAALINEYGQSLDVQFVGGTPEDPKPDDYFDAHLSALTIGTPLFALINGYFNYVYSNDSDFADSVNRSVYIQYDCLPDNIFVGRYPTLDNFSVSQSPTSNSYDWYDGSVSFVPSAYGISEGFSFCEILVNNEAYSNAGYKYNNFPTSYCVMLGNPSKFYMSMQLLYVDNGQFNIVNGYEGNRNGFMAIVSPDDNESYSLSFPWTYANWLNCSSDIGNFFIYNCYASFDTSGHGIAVLLPDGSLYLDNQVYRNGHCVSDTRALPNVSPITGSGFLDYVSDFTDAFEKELPIDKTPSLSREQIQAITNNVSNYYDQTATNYYEDISYITGDTYIENVVNNYYNPPVDDTPAIPDSGILSGLQSLLEWLFNALKGVLEWLGTTIVDGFTALFIPDQAVIDGYISLVLENFDWIDEFKNFSVMVTDVFRLDPEIPKISIDFSKSSGNLHDVGKTYALDMTWYAPYKKTVDDIIVSIAWLWFAWWAFRNIPEIIAGNNPSSVKEGE